jgi:adenylate cyclase
MSHGTIDDFAAEAALRMPSLDSGLGQRIVALNIWATRQGLRGVEPEILLDGLCRRLVAAGLPLWRAFAGMRTLHPQWAGYGYTWWRDRGIVEPAQFARGGAYEEIVANSVFGDMIRRLEAGEHPGEQWLALRRRFDGPLAQCDFPGLDELAAAGGTDFFAELVGFGVAGDASRGSGVGVSFATDRSGGFADDDLTLLRAVVPILALAMMAQASHTIAAGLLETYLGADAGKRVHAGAVARGSVDGIRAVLWYADIRGFTAIADRAPGLAVIELLNEVFEALTEPLRRRGGQVLKFLGDGMLATFPIGDAGTEASCGAALDAAIEAMEAVDRLNRARRDAGKPAAAVDLALHLGEVLYGNVGAADRLDFTVIGPAVNEAARIETLCEPLGAPVLVSAELAAAAGDRGRLRSLGRHALRGVREEREIFALELGGPA